MTDTQTAPFMSKRDQHNSVRDLHKQLKQYPEGSVGARTTLDSLIFMEKNYGKSGKPR